AAGTDVQLVPDFSASLWNRIAITDRLDIALGVIHQGEQFASISNAVVLPAYTRVDAGIFYALSDRVDLQLNIENVFDETYWYTAHGDNNISPGSPTAARLTLSASF
ncbi:MAG: TonB-dependent receptor, partial [Dehalococcoidia bacterium]|nr:TonB-dependent receptor [Dehalococcoidia bacterium]